MTTTSYCICSSFSCLSWRQNSCKRVMPHHTPQPCSRANDKRGLAGIDSAQASHYSRSQSVAFPERGESPLVDDREKGGMVMEWTHRTAVVNGIHIHYVIHGHGAPVILLHGWPEFWYGWRQQIPVLGERFAVIVPAMRRFGYSHKPLPRSATPTPPPDPSQFAPL